MRTLVVICVLVAPAARALAQCRVNADCPPNTYCSAGQCVTPGAPPPTVYQPQPYLMPQPMYVRPYSRGWALGAGVFGLIEGVTVLALGAGAEVTRASQVPSLPLGGAATLIHIVSGPIVAVGGASTRRGAGVEGILGLRITGWITYGLTIAGAVALLGLGIQEIRPPAGLIIGFSGGGFLTGVFFGVDALVADAQARHRAPPPPQQPPLTLAPVIGAGRDGSAVFGVGGAF